LYETPVMILPPAIQLEVTTMIAPFTPVQTPPGQFFVWDHDVVPIA
jgi:hypothetical protein